jgi:two-component system phosphate regulon sensor histidine kinase PhoR
MNQFFFPPPAFRLSAVPARLAAQAPLLAGTAVVLLGFAAILVGALLLPRPGTAPPPVLELPLLAENRHDDAVFAFADALADPCLVLDRRGAVLHVNGPAGRQFPALGGSGQPVTLLLRNPELVRAIDLALRSGKPQAVELHETLPSETWDKVVVSPLQRRGQDWLADEARQLVVTFQSLTELKRVEALRSDFIANASHELRTPLASLLGFIDTLLGPAAKDAAAREKFLLIMRGQAERMSKLVDDLLSLSRIEMHQHVRPTASIELAGLLREVREGLMIQARAADIEIRMTLFEGPSITTGDRSQLYEVFENLLDNAIKYGAGGKYVEIGLAPSGRAGFSHVVTVIDHGPGVEVDQVPRLTERFYRIDAEASRRKKGTGLGLAIVKHIVNRHRGQMSIRSAPGEGMRVDVFLP